MICVTRNQLQKKTFFNMFISSIMYFHIIVSNVTTNQIEKDIFFNMFILTMM